MEQATKDAINLWQEESRQKIPQNFDVFHNLVNKAEAYAKTGKYAMAAAYCEMASSYASGKTCGVLVSSELEKVLLSIGLKAIRGHSNFTKSKSAHQSSQPKILHVATTMASIGGHSRMLWRWIKQDQTHSHSLALTRQFPKPIPKALEDAVKDSNGNIYQLNCRYGSLLEWAKQLRKLASNADLVILHVHNFDVIPMLAFAAKEDLPPICLLDHADHLFWLGAGISDLVISLRESGMALAKSRRMIDAERIVLLPIILDPIQRNISREMAKQELGLPQDCILLLSIARGIKYNTIDGISFADAHVSLLQKYRQAILIVVGPGDRPEWKSAIDQTEGRIKVFSETEHTSLFYQAADIYVDSFPFVSNTSLLEAGSYSSPLVSRYPYPSESSAVLGADMPGLTGNLIRVKSLEEYTNILSRLIEDKDFRQNLGESTRRKIEDTHWGKAWEASLQKVYSHAYNISKIPNPMYASDQMFVGEPDSLLQHVHDIDISRDDLIRWHLPLMPFSERLYYWDFLRKKYGFRNTPVNLLMSEWFRSYYYAGQKLLKSFLLKI